MKVRTHLTGSSKEVSRRLSILDNKVVVTRLRVHAALRQQQFLASFGKAVRRYTVLVQVPKSLKAAKLSIHTSSSPCLPHLAPTTRQIFHYQLSHRSVSSFSNALVSSVSLLVSHTDDGSPQRSTIRRSRLVLPLKRQTQELRKLSIRLLRQRTGVVQGLENISGSLSKGFEHCQNRVAPMGSFCSSFRKKPRTRPVLVHPRRRSPEAGLVSALHGMLLTVVVRSLNPNQFPQKRDFFDRKEQIRSALFRYERRAKKSNQRALARLKVVVSQSQ